MGKTELKPLYDMPEDVLERINNDTDRIPLIGDNELADLTKAKAPSGYHMLKRALDVIVSAVALAVLAVPCLLVAAAIYIDDPGRILFKQYRIGVGGKRFKLYKFRSMRTSTPKYLATMDVNDPDAYLTRVGRLMRKLSIDELPQLINVLRGDMSIIGPRPLIADEYEIHQERMRLGVYAVRPGITGLAQINGRDIVSPGDKVRWDVKYVQQFSLTEDIKILFLTVLKVFKREGVVEGYNANREVDSSNDKGDCNNGNV